MKCRTVCLIILYSVQVDIVETTELISKKVSSFFNKSLTRPFKQIHQHHESNHSQHLLHNSWVNSTGIELIVDNTQSSVSGSPLTRFTSNERNLESRIVGGEPANFGEFPSFGFRSCGGTLIHHDIFLTAAHCSGSFKPKRPILLRRFSGVTIGGIKVNGGDGKKFNALYEVVHPNFDNKFFSTDSRNDIMIVKLGISRHTGTIPLQQLNFNSTIPGDDQPLTVIGIGLTNERDRFSFPRKLRKVTINTVDNNTCRKQVQGFDAEKMLCAGVPEGGKGVCQGDSGGPILTENGAIQVGIASFSDGCGKIREPGAYTRISHYEDFIKDMICGHSDKLDGIDYCEGRPRLRPVCPCRRFRFVCRLLNGCSLF